MEFSLLAQHVDELHNLSFLLYLPSGCLVCTCSIRNLFSVLTVTGLERMTRKLFGRSPWICKMVLDATAPSNIFTYTYGLVAEGSIEPWRPDSRATLFPCQSLPCWGNDRGHGWFSCLKESWWSPPRDCTRYIAWRTMHRAEFRNTSGTFSIACSAKLEIAWVKRPQTTNQKPLELAILTASDFKGIWDYKTTLNFVALTDTRAAKQQDGTHLLHFNE